VRCEKRLTWTIDYKSMHSMENNHIINYAYPIIDYPYPHNRLSMILFPNNNLSQKKIMEHKKICCQKRRNKKERRRTEKKNREQKKE